MIRMLMTFAAALMLTTAAHANDHANDTAVVMPDLSGTPLLGKALFEQKCAECHGANLMGTDQGPPLLHPVYRPNHHADYAFLLAVRNGVRAHHWKFGNMAPVEGLTDANVGMIVQFVRTVQKANGLY